jgi:hypothetical protein
VDVIRRYERNLNYWHSERDAGIYDAINKGIRKCRGHFFYVLNVGDRLLQFPAQALRSAVESQADVATFAVQLANGRVHRSRIDYRSKFANTIHHQGAFYRLDLGIQYDTRFRIFSDFDQNQKLYKAGRRFVECQGIVCFHDLDGISNDPSKRGEYFTIVRLNFGPFWELIGRTYIAQGEFRQKLRKLLTGK